MKVESRNWRVVAASVTGTSHGKRGEPCQDAFSWEILPGNILVAAVADGAGSAPKGEVGAEVAVNAAVEAVGKGYFALTAHDTHYSLILKKALQAALAAVKEKANQLDLSVGDLASTLILVVTTGNLVAAAQVGDGAAVIGDCSGNIIPLTIPYGGEYANETTFLISPYSLETAQIKVWRGTVSNLAIFSDGLQRLALNMPEGEPYEPFFSPLFHFTTKIRDETVAEKELIGFLDSGRVREKTDDDLTLLLAAFA